MTLLYVEILQDRACCTGPSAPFALPSTLQRTAAYWRCRPGATLGCWPPSQCRVSGLAAVAGSADMDTGLRGCSQQFPALPCVQHQPPTAQHIASLHTLPARALRGSCSCPPGTCDLDSATLPQSQDSPLCPPPLHCSAAAPAHLVRASSGCHVQRSRPQVRRAD